MRRSLPVRARRLVEAGDGFSGDGDGDNSLSAALQDAQGWQDRKGSPTPLAGPPRPWRIPHAQKPAADVAMGHFSSHPWGERTYPGAAPPWARRARADGRLVARPIASVASASMTTLVRHLVQQLRLSGPGSKCYAFWRRRSARSHDARLPSLRGEKGAGGGNGLPALQKAPPLGRAEPRMNSLHEFRA